MSDHERVLRMLTKMRARIATLEAENKRLREALEGICAPEYGLHGIIEDYGDDANAYNYHAAEYWECRAMAKSQRARAALKE